ncbi:MAG: type IX secretion system outer membrane channel protein PorV [Bacteroidales bacterium]|nr:type IX secretion system outer membrane channel protein PorV [Bacteroidales bacterium]MDD4217491.1 type IX secretion system outer membrane channel protein PorV [Bacteroidales bacterium]MDY0140912.1 type IX secretion system outer membrane channel protein PorV [Bacteroidales bacterium]
MIKKSIIVFTILMSMTVFSYGQVTQDDVIGRDAPNTITTTVPFLLIAPDSRAGGLGDAGVATTPDVNSQHWNPAKYSFITNDVGVSISYTPWLRQLVQDMNLAYISAYKRINQENVFSASLLYFDLGSIQFRDIHNTLVRDFTPHEFAVDFAYSRLLGKHFSGAVAMRFIYSNLTGGIEVQGSQSFPGKTVAADFALYYHNDEIEIGGMPGTLMWGLNISNIGGKISYTDNENRDFIPMNFRTGLGYVFKLDDHNHFMVTVDFNKLLVPTPPVYYNVNDILPNGDTVFVGDRIVKYGKETDVSVGASLFQSWYDAPGLSTAFIRDKDGDGVGTPSPFREELAEFTISAGLEYWYDKQFALRLGYFNEHQYKGNRKYFTVGAGLKMNVFGLDFAYLIPTTQANPLQNTLRFTLTFDIGGLAAEKS